MRVPRTSKTRNVAFITGTFPSRPPLYGDGDPLMDTLGSGEDIEEILIQKDIEEMLHKNLTAFKKMLNKKERFILDHRIMAEEPLTLREIGERFKTSRERVRQIQAKIWKNLVKNLRPDGNE